MTNIVGNRYSLTVRMVVGALIGLGVISLLLLSVDEPRPEWGAYWMVQPLVMVPLAGAAGGFCNFVLFRFGVLFGVGNKWVAGTVSAIVFLIGLWLGVVLGLNGTMWN